jgi:DNA-entry nuclease
MAYCENLARMWLEDYPDGWLAYVATPVYEGDELVCRSVIVDMLSSDGELDVRIEVFNAAKGYTIDYATGEFWPASAS